MGRILPKRKYFRSSIFQPKLDSDSHIDNVKYSLEHLIFLNAKETENVILKKHIKVVVIITLILMIIGYFISPKGQAEVAVFYPSSCLGGWNNPQNAEGEPEAKVNDDQSLFTLQNSAILPKETFAEIYCGNFVGAIEQNTKPTKMIITLSWSTKDQTATLQEVAAASTSDTVLLGASSTEIATSSLSTSTLATSTILESSSTTEVVASTSSDTATSTSVATTTDTGVSLLDTAINAVKDVISSLFSGGSSTSTQEVAAPEVSNQASTTVSTTTDPALQVSTQVASSSVDTQTQTATPDSAPAATETPASDASTSGPTSFLQNMLNVFASKMITKVFAEEIVAGDASSTGVTAPQVSSSSLLNTVTVTAEGSSSTNATTSDMFASTTDIVASSSSSSIATTTEASNDFLEVLYTFDGVTWNSLGKVDETSIKYRTFEVPVSASTTWDDVHLLQIKVQSVERVDPKPVVYLDGIKVEVLYETPLTHEHPDFKRDTILQDEVVNGIRVLRIINNDTNKEEVWYMHPEEATSTSLLTASTTAPGSDNATTTNSLSDTSNATDTVKQGTTTADILPSPDRVIKPSMQKNVWMKLESDETSAKGTEALVKEIQKQEERQEFMIPDFSKDFIKKIQGRSLNAVVVQVEQEGKDSMWLFNIDDDTEEKIDKDGKTTFSKTYPFGMKGDNIFWLSEDNGIVYMYNVVTKKLQQMNVPPYDVSLGERAEVVFDGFPWKVVIGADQFSFFSGETGEVFSDDNLSASEAFRVKEKLDTFMTQDKIEELNLIVNDAAAQ